MGKATILPSGALELAPGQYRVRIEKDQTSTEAEIKRIDTELTALDNEVSDRYTDYENANRAYHQAKNDLDEVIHQAQESPEVAHASKLNAATNAATTAQTDARSKKARYDNARLKQNALRSKKVYLDSVIGEEDVRVVWCADCQRDLEGTVATVEIPNTDQEILIRPGGADGSGSSYSASRDGQLRSVGSMSPAEAVWNYTMFPGWQRYKPLYRLGKITARPPNSSKCSVLLDAYSTAQDLTTDEERQLTNVEMIYKGRDDGGPYQVGDRVLVRFFNQNQEAPQVVGFEQSPCTTTSSTTTSSSTTSSSTTTSMSTTTTTSAGPLQIWFDVLVTQLDITFTTAEVIGGHGVGGPNVSIISKNGVPMTGWNYYVSPSDPSYVRLEANTPYLDPDGYWLVGTAANYWIVEIGATQYPFKHGTDRWQDADLISPYSSFVFDLAYWEKTTQSDVVQNLIYTGNVRQKRTYVKSNLPVEVRYSAGIDIGMGLLQTRWISPVTFLSNPGGFPPNKRCCVGALPTALLANTEFGDVDPPAYAPAYLFTTNFGGATGTCTYGSPFTTGGTLTQVAPAPTTGKTYRMTTTNVTGLTTATTNACYCSGAYPECTSCAPTHLTYDSAWIEPAYSMIYQTILPEIP